MIRKNNIPKDLIYKMDLHDVLPTDFGKIMRVHGGWIYYFDACLAPVFVPASNDQTKADYIPRKQMKTLIGIRSDTTMIDFERKGILTPYRVGKKIMYRRDEIEKCLKEYKRVKDEKH